MKVNLNDFVTVRLTAFGVIAADVEHIVAPGQPWRVQWYVLAHKLGADLWNGNQAAIEDFTVEWEPDIGHEPFDPLTCPPAQLVGLVGEFPRPAGGTLYRKISDVRVFSGNRDVMVGGAFTDLDNAQALHTPGPDGREVWRRP